jgi:hypothetical protein
MGDQRVWWWRSRLYSLEHGRRSFSSIMRKAEGGAGAGVTRKKYGLNEPDESTENSSCEFVHSAGKIQKGILVLWPPKIF